MSNIVFVQILDYTRALFQLFRYAMKVTWTAMTFWWKYGRHRVKWGRLMTTISRPARSWTGRVRARNNGRYDFGPKMGYAKGKRLPTPTVAATLKRRPWGQTSMAPQRIPRAGGKSAAKYVEGRNEIQMPTAQCHGCDKESRISFLYLRTDIPAINRVVRRLKFWMSNFRHGQPMGAIFCVWLICVDHFATLFTHELQKRTQFVFY